MADFLEQLMEALEELTQQHAWCVQFFGENDVVVYHCHIDVPTREAPAAAAMAMELAIRQNVSLVGAVGCIAAMVMEVDPEAGPHTEQMRRERHGNTAPVQFNPEHGPATIEGLPEAGKQPAQPGGRHYH